MEKYQFKIEDVIIKNPEGWKDFELRLKRDEDISGLLVSSTNKFTFKGDGYDILQSRFDANYNDKISVSIDILQSDNTYIEQYSGVVILTDVSFNLEKRLAEATIEDASFQGAIQGNKNVKTFLNAGLTKNGETTAALTVFNLDYFIGNFYQGLANRRAYLLKDALDFLVRFMTDDLVKGIQSSYLDDVNNFEGDSLPYITTGISIRLENQDAPNVSFSECIIFLQRTHDLTFDFVINSDGDPVMRIEESEFFFNASTIDTIRSIKDLKVKVDANRVASHLEVGNNTSKKTGNCSATTRWFTFRKEDYSLRGKGNIDKLLDLTIDFITDSNVIQDIIVNATTDFDDDIIIVLGNIAGNQAAKFRTPTYCSNLFFYNQGFTNDKIINRQLNSIPNSVTKYLTAATTPSKAELGQSIQVTVPTLNVPLIFNNKINLIDEKYDLGGNYNTSDTNNTFYDIPFAGKFSFEIQVKVSYRIVSITGTNTTTTLNPAMFLLRFDSSFTVPVEETVPVGSFLNLTGVVGDIVTITHTISATMDCDSGDRIQVVVGTAVLGTVGLTNINLTIDQGGQNTFFKCLGSEDDAGTFTAFDPNSFRAKLYTFEKNLSLTRTNKIRANTRNSIVINELSDTKLDKITWIEEMVNNIDTGATSFTMIK